MQTKEIEKQLGITKDALRFYEKEGLIKPKRDENGYRNYSQEDIRLLKMIMFFRSMEVTIDEIKLLLDGTASIQEILHFKQSCLENEIEQKRKTLEMISHTLKRRKAYFGYLSIPYDYQKEIYVCFKENELDICDYYHHYEYKTWAYCDIEKIKLSICTRISSQVIRHNKIVQIERYVTGLYTDFYIDLDIQVGQTIYQYESISLDHMHDIAKILSKLDVVYDPLGLLPIFQTNKEQSHIYKILISHLKGWEKEYHIDNPRSSEIKNHVQVISTNIRKKDTKLKDIVGQDKIGFIKYQMILLIVVGVFALLWFLFRR